MPHTWLGIVRKWVVQPNNPVLWASELNWTDVGGSLEPGTWEIRCNSASHFSSPLKTRANFSVNAGVVAISSSKKIPHFPFSQGVLHLWGWFPIPVLRLGSYLPAWRPAGYTHQEALWCSFGVFWCYELHSQCSLPKSPARHHSSVYPGSPSCFWQPFSSCVWQVSGTRVSVIAGSAHPLGSQGAHCTAASLTSVLVLGKST